MDWFKLFALLMLSALCSVATGSSRKKIRIHIPQKVKHIHHHKKIYITQHPAPTQYAPAFLPSDGVAAVALPTAVAGLVPLKPLPYYEERRGGRLHGISSASSALLPMYRARGYYGPTAYDRRPSDSLTAPSSAGEPSSPSPPSSSPGSSPRVKVIKIDAPRKKKVIKKKKPKRIIIQEEHEEEEVEEPVSTYHDEFYSDLNASGSIKTVKKPKRIEKYIDGDTEHIHTYSEEHIHQFVFDDQNPKPELLDGSAGGHNDGPYRSPSTLHPNTQYSSQKPSFYPSSNTGYPPQDITHDHLFHDHGEVPMNFDFSKPYNTLPKSTYNSDGTKIGGTSMKTNKKRKSKPKNKGKWVPQDNVIKGTKQNSELSYYEGMYASSYNKPKKSPFSYGGSSDAGYDELSYRPKYKNSYKAASSPYTVRAPTTRKPSMKVVYHNAETSPFGISSIYPENSYKGYSRVKDSYYRDPYNSHRDSYAPPTYDYDAYASSSSYDKDRDSPVNPWRNKKGKGKKKSVSTQNISFGGQDHKTVIDHIAESSDAVMTIDETAPSAPAQGDFAFEAFPPTNRDEYYTDMAVKAFEASSVIPEASNNNFRIVEPPIAMSTSSPTPSSELPIAVYVESDAAAAATAAPAAPAAAPSAPKRLKKKPIDKKVKTRPQPKTNPIKEVKYQMPAIVTLDERGRRKYGDKVEDDHSPFAFNSSE